MPLEHIARRCGGSLYHTWLPLDVAQQPSRGTPLGSPGTDSNSYELFDKALRNAARDPRLPLVCISLCQADMPRAESERYDLKADPTERSLRFCSLLQSHAQHSRLLQALYRQCRAGRQAASEAERQPQMLPQLRDALVDSWASVARHDAGGLEFAGPPEALHSAGARRAGETPVASGQLDVGTGQLEEEASRLRQQIEGTTREANSRINQASEAIRTLKEWLAAKQAEHERLRRESLRARRDGDALENENEQLRLQLERRAREHGSPDEKREELRRLRRDAEVLGEQKEALVLILEDLYGAVGQEAAAPQEPEPPRAEEAPAAEEPQETWTNMLPRPSELFASGVLDER